MIKTIKKNSDLNILKVITKLEVGPVKIDTRRLVAPYKITQNNKQDSIEHIFCFEEDVFDPNEPESINLASMIVAQVAINYGLFCNDFEPYLHHGECAPTLNFNSCGLHG